MSVQISSGQSQSGGGGLGSIMSIFNMAGGGGKKPSDNPDSYKDPTAAWNPQQLQQPDLGTQPDAFSQQLKPQVTGANDSFLSMDPVQQARDAITRRQTAMNSGKMDNGKLGSIIGGITSLMG